MTTHEPREPEREADAATELGIDWSRRTGAELVGMGVVDEPTICRPEPTGAAFDRPPWRRSPRHGVIV